MECKTVTYMSNTALLQLNMQHMSFFFLKKYATYVIILINQNWKEKGSPKKKKAHPLTVGS